LSIFVCAGRGIPGPRWGTARLIPGTTVFDGEQSRRGYHLNQFCMSLLNPTNRDRFKADEEAYLSEWSLTETQKSAVLRRDYNAMIAEGGNIYFLGKIGATDGKSFVQLAASMTGMTPESYMAMMVRGAGRRARRSPRRSLGADPRGCSHFVKNLNRSS
jgi:protocatechuate 4,5-dioxygenase alpha subunit